MAFIGRLHPLLIHFPIALVIAAAAADVAAVVTADDGWRTVAVRTLRAGATFAAALATSAPRSRSALEVWIYRIALFAAGVLVAVTGHLGGLLVWAPTFCAHEGGTCGTDR